MQAGWRDERRQRICGVYVITDRYINPLHDHISISKTAIEGGASAIQLRDKRATTRELISWALRMRQMTACTRTLLIINDRLDVAMACKADGVHLGDDDMPIEIARELVGESMLIGRSVDNVEQAVEAERMGADYVSIGAVFPTATKPNAAQAVGIETVRAVKMAVNIPVVAIGGITVENAHLVIEAGADAIAVISAVAMSDEPLAAVKELVRIYEIHRGRL
ncbi:MAG: thiamine phosphate synthase [Armatimonadota bacterium]|nr:thiamine phosphate synthase [Armatimonadota bacterium]MCX7776820.1 thiamine phosphate synthase [Armatimonadota bacterium]MDW8024615.1 thiamine phosphate synthase [Armatimonadota bacterium]